MAREVILDRLRVAGDTAGTEEQLGIRRTQAGEGYAQNARDGLAGRIEQHAGNQPRGDEQFRGGGGGEGAEQVVVFGADGGAGIAVGDLVGGLVGLLIGNLGGIDSMVGHKHALQAIENEQPGTVLKMVEQPLAELGVFSFLKLSSGWRVM